MGLASKNCQKHFVMLVINLYLLEVLRKQDKPIEQPVVTAANAVHAAIHTEQQISQTNPPPFTPSEVPKSYHRSLRKGGK